MCDKYSELGQLPDCFVVLRCAINGSLFYDSIFGFSSLILVRAEYET